MGLFNRKPKGDEEAEPQGARQPAHDRAVPPQTFVPTALSVHADLLPREFIEERQDAKVLRLAGIGVAGLLAIGLLASLGTGAVAFSSNRALGQEQDRAAQLAQEKTKYADASSIAGQISGSSDVRWGSWGESAVGEEHAEPVVVAVAEAAGEATVQLVDPVHGLSSAVR
jgi:hypothetical protein